MALALTPRGSPLFGQGCVVLPGSPYPSHKATRGKQRQLSNARDLDGPAVNTRSKAKSRTKSKKAPGMSTKALTVGTVSTAVDDDKDSVSVGSWDSAMMDMDEVEMEDGQGEQRGGDTEGGSPSDASHMGALYNIACSPSPPPEQGDTRTDSPSFMAMESPPRPHYPYLTLRTTPHMTFAPPPPRPSSPPTDTDHKRKKPANVSPSPSVSVSDLIAPGSKP
ncbi:unnamed protein product [Vitrella brassicaformis CCMP3155]|uniref:Uncharacterized protein n=1 Tax=Vitrella brassicaformis (strain CCMP3155) TaxID=1169540 RepID=A0A0G4G1I8_VITBC|nr:unnamed protein product [Vitrella brassicaformis CCMP3155]|eukprot:CEM21888.1 unnamed protein product [Vitrella brassicaformis CCMP3155]